MNLALYPILALLDFVFSNIIARVLFNWWVPAFASADGWLPRWLAWFQTFDASLDAGWRDGYFEADGTPTGWRLHWLRVRWLNRNSAYGFSYWFLGIPFVAADWTFTWENTPQRELFIARSAGGLFNVSYYGRWGRLKLGWKAWNYFDAAANGWKPGYQWGPLMRTPITFSYTPFQRKAA